MTQVLLALLVLSTVAQGVEIAGNWVLAETTFDDENGGQRKIDCAFQRDGRKLTGKCANNEIMGDIDMQRVTWQRIVNYDHHTATLFYQGVLDEHGSTIRGTWRCPKHCENAAYKRGTFVLSKH